MYKSSLLSATTAITILLLVTACAEEGKQAVSAETPEAQVAEKTSKPVKKKDSPPTSREVATKTAEVATNMDAPIMSQPVDFSTPENVAKTMQAIGEQAGPQAVRKIESVMGYMLTYDLGVGRDEARLHKKLNGKTPKEIIAIGSARRR